MPLPLYPGLTTPQRQNYVGSAADAAAAADARRAGGSPPIGAGATSRLDWEEEACALCQRQQHWLGAQQQWWSMEESPDFLWMDAEGPDAARLRGRASS